MPRNTSNGTPVNVALTAPKIRYAFRSRVKNADDRKALGQTSITTSVNATDANAGPIVVSPSSPKPRKARKTTETGSIGSFCADASVAKLREDGWHVGRRKIRFGTSGSLARTAYVKINGIKYAWSFTLLEGGTVPSEFGKAGVEDPNKDDADLVFAPDFPRPPRFIVLHEGNSFSTFYDPDKENDLAGEQGVRLDKSDYLFTSEQLKDMFGIA